jgi:DNA-binding transcriptional LysR family regulator
LQWPRAEADTIFEVKIPASHLEAFLAVARVGRFALAAKQLGLSQSALSQRILNLESQLEKTLFVRDRAGSRLTPEGEGLLRYALAQEALEQEYLSRGGGAAGTIRVGGFSSVTRSLLLPALAPLARELKIGLSVFSREVGTLPDLLRQGEADLIALDRELEKEGVSSEFLGFEENVLVRGKKNTPAIYLDHDADDLTTQRYFQKFAGKSVKTLERRFLDDVYGIIDGVRLGLGQAVVPLHLVEGKPGVEVLDPGKVLSTPVWLHFPSQGYYPTVQRKARELLIAYARARLAQK